MSEFEIKRLSSGNLQDMYLLFRSVYNRAPAKGYFERKYDTRYTGIENIGYFVYYNHKPVAFYGVVPVFFLIKNSKVLAAQSCDTMTHPDFQNRGFFIKLAEKTYALAHSEGIHFIFGFPNERSFSGFINRLGFTHTETMRLFTRDVNWFPGKKLIHKLFFILPVFVKKTVENELLNEFDGIEYSEAYLKYKGYNSNRIIKICNYPVWINDYSQSFIGAVAMQYVRENKEPLEQIAKKIYASSVSFAVSPGTNIERTLSKKYESTNGLPVIIKNLSGTYPLDRLKFQFSDIDIF